MQHSHSYDTAAHVVYFAVVIATFQGRQIHRRRVPMVHTQLRNFMQAYRTAICRVTDGSKSLKIRRLPHQGGFDTILLHTIVLDEAACCIRVRLLPNANLQASLYHAAKESHAAVCALLIAPASNGCDVCHAC